jgi:hypothetical protein
LLKGESNHYFFAGFQVLDQSTNFNSGGKEAVTIMINIEPFYNHISGILAEPPHESMVESPEF